MPRARRPPRRPAATLPAPGRAAATDGSVTRPRTRSRRPVPSRRSSNDDLPAGRRPSIRRRRRWWVLGDWGEPGPEERDVQQVHVYASATAVANANAPVLTRSDDPIISARDVVKRYDETVAVAGLDLTIWPGEIFGILGPNGAGKTTTLEMLEGLRAPDGGEIRVAGFDPVSEPDQVHRVIGVQLQSTALFDYLNCAEIIALFAALYRANASPA